MSFARTFETNAFAQRNLRFHPAYETPRDKQRRQRERDDLVADNRRLVEINKRLRAARILPAIA